MALDRMQTQRFELKYLITEEVALKVRDFVRCYLNLDEYSTCQPNLSYPVHSLYLDSADLKTYWDTVNGDKNRFKLRLRYYSVEKGTPVFFEIKRRVNSCIMKQRGGVKQEAVEWLLSGHLPKPEHLLSKTDKALVALQRFCQLSHQIQAKPRIHISYLREAYVSDNDKVRVTMDRKVHAEPNQSYSVKTKMGNNPKYSFQPYVILELKFTDRYPDWFQELVRVF
jgi:SPX domain protein involved in polyphosphate accumulation